MDELSDNELVSLYLKGQSSALDQLVKRYFRQVFFFVKSYVKETGEAEDITQETFVKLWKNLSKFDPEKKFKTWLFQIAKNTCIDFLRKYKNQVPAENVQEDNMAEALERIVDKTPLPQDLFDSQDFADRLEQALAILPEIYRQTVTLHLQQDLTFQEIAEILGQPLNTIKSRYRRALAMVRDGLTKP